MPRFDFIQASHLGSNTAFSRRVFVGEARLRQLRHRKQGQWMPTDVVYDHKLDRGFCSLDFAKRLAKRAGNSGSDLKVGASVAVEVSLVMRETDGGWGVSEGLDVHLTVRKDSALARYGKAVSVVLAKDLAIPRKTPRLRVYNHFHDANECVGLTLERLRGCCRKVESLS